MAVVSITGHQQFSYTYSAHEGNLYFTAQQSSRPLIYNFDYNTYGVKYKDNSRLTKKMPESSDSRVLVKGFDLACLRNYKETTYYVVA